MNIFLLFISMFIMIGYYIMYSPSQNISKQETQYVIEQSDIRSIAECVISIQNKMMYCQNLDNFETDCATRYSITSQYVQINDQGSVIGNGSMANLCSQIDTSDLIPHKTYIITTSYALPVEERDNMLDILEKYYSDRGTLGIIDGSNLLVADSIVAREIPANVINTAELQDGQLAYIMQYRTPTLPWDEPTNEPDQPPVCPEGTTLINVAGVWRCRPNDPLTFCQAGTIWNPDTMDCEPTEEFTCESENATLVQMADGTWVCLEPEMNEDCENGVTVLNGNTLQWECISVSDPESFKENCNKNKPGYVFSKSDLKTGAGPTLKVKTISCGRCEKPTLDKETCDMYCIPDESKLNTRTCFSGDPTCCTGEDRGIYFGFTEDSRTDGIVGADGKPITIDLENVLDEYHETNRKFNCLKCKYSSLDMSKSISPYVAVCTGGGESENIDAVKAADGGECSANVVAKDEQGTQLEGNIKKDEDDKQSNQQSGTQDKGQESGDNQSTDTTPQENILKPKKS